jgi:hypothetical protein
MKMTPRKRGVLVIPASPSDLTQTGAAGDLDCWHHFLVC